MNDKIKQLAVEAGLVDFVGKIKTKKTEELKVEIFAEMLIKETLQVARAGLEYGPSMDEVVYGYFGVEE